MLNLKFASAANNQFEIQFINLIKLWGAGLRQSAFLHCQAQTSLILIYYKRLFWRAGNLGGHRRQAQTR